VEDDEPIELPDTTDMLVLNEAMRQLLDAFRAEAQRSASYGAWGATRSLETACYYLWGAMGYLAKDEGLIP
jgi:hypothetical protein